MKQLSSIFNWERLDLQQAKLQCKAQLIKAKQSKRHTNPVQKIPYDKVQQNTWEQSKEKPGNLEMVCGKQKTRRQARMALAEVSLARALGSLGVQSQFAGEGMKANSARLSCL